MVNGKKLVLMFTLFVLLISFPLMAAEKGSARISVIKPLVVAGTDIEIQPGKYDARWKAEGETVTVVFTPVGKPKGIEVKGKMETVDRKYEFDSVGMGTDASGRTVIKNLQLKGKTQRIVFE
jgi:hypothetical protein